MNINKLDKIVIVCFLLVVFTSDYARADDFCGDWLPYVKSDSRIAAYQIAGCKGSPEGVEYITAEHDPEADICDLWYHKDMYEDEIADWSQYCGRPKDGGGCDIEPLPEGGLVVFGVCDAQN